MSKAIFVALAATLAGAGCSSSSGNNSGPVADSLGAVIGPPDHHCVSPDGGLIVQTIGVCNVSDPSLEPSSPASCSVSFSNSSGGTDGGASTDYGPTMYGSAGDDDDCKYYLSWVSTPIEENVDTYFTVTALRLEDMKPATCATIIPDTALNPTHPPAGPPKPSVELSPGVYKVGPIPFDAPGIWTVRFHLYEECGDSQDDSPHGHAAFYVQVP
ncbi:MAG TPA: hypothetical protein VN853_23465 [Polyangia bacterium]|nr:hypothetical protein [Polyangia bacterium]